MRNFALLPAALAAGIASAGPAPEFQPVPPDILAAVAAQGQPDNVRAWSGDFTGDGVPDAMVQVARAMGGGNAYTLDYLLFQGGPGGYVWTGSAELVGAIQSADIAPGRIDLVMTVMLPGDPRCCPSGRTTVRVLPP